MRGCMAFIVCLSLVTASFVAGEEPNNDATFLQFFEQLPAEPTEEQRMELIQEFDRHASTQSFVGVNESDVDIRLAELLTLLGVAGFDSEYILQRVYGMPTGADLDRGVSIRKVERKSVMLALLVYEYIISKASELGLDTLSVRALSAMRSYVFRLVPRHDDLVRYEEYASEYYAEVVSRLGVERNLDAKIEKIAGKLVFSRDLHGYLGWREVVDSGTLSDIDLSAYAYWFWSSGLTRSFIKSRDPLTRIESVTSHKSLAEEMLLKELVPGKEEWNEQDWLRPNDGSKCSSKLLLTHFFLVVGPEMFRDEYAFFRKEALAGYAGSIAYVFSSGIGVMHSRMYADFMSADAAISKREVIRHKRLIDNGRFKMVMEAEGEGGAAWFVGDRVTEGKGKCDVEVEDFIYPLSYVATGKDGFAQYMSSCGDPRYKQAMLGRTPWFEWKWGYYGNTDECPKVVYKGLGRLKYEYDYSPDGIEEMRRSGMYERMCAGLNGVGWKSVPSGEVLDVFRPATYYHFEKTVWRMYSQADYDSQFDVLGPKKPAIFIVLYPKEDATPDDIIPGLLFKGIDNWLVRSGFSYMSRKLWIADELEYSEDFRSIRRKADEFADEFFPEYRDKYDKYLKESGRRYNDAHGIKPVKE